MSKPGYTGRTTGDHNRKDSSLVQFGQVQSTQEGSNADDQKPLKQKEETMLKLSVGLNTSALPEIEDMESNGQQQVLKQKRFQLK